jgi:heme exporter protein C
MTVSHEENMAQVALRGTGSGWAEYFLPQVFFPIAGRMIPWAVIGASTFCGVGLYLRFFATPVGSEHGAVFLIAFIHVPAAWVSVLVYLALALSAGVGVLYNARLFGMLAQALAPTGIMFAFLALWTGCLWGKPVWGTWWVWDPRLATELLLLVLYAGFIGLHATIRHPEQADKAGALLALVGSVNLPVIYVAVQWWTTQQHAAPLALTGGFGMAAGTLAAIVVVTLGFCMYEFAVALARLRCLILERERDSDWVAQYVSTLP